MTVNLFVLVLCPLPYLMKFRRSDRNVCCNRRKIVHAVYFFLLHLVCPALLVTASWLDMNTNHFLIKSEDENKCVDTSVLVANSSSSLEMTEVYFKYQDSPVPCVCFWTAQRIKHDHTCGEYKVMGAEFMKVGNRTCLDTKHEFLDKGLGMSVWALFGLCWVQLIFQVAFSSFMGTNEYNSSEETWLTTIDKVEAPSKVINQVEAISFEPGASCNFDAEFENLPKYNDITR